MEIIDSILFCIKWNKFGDRMVGYKNCRKIDLLEKNN